MTAWRTIVTDSESMSGVAPVRERQDDPSSMHRGDAHGVYDCCPHPHIETWGEGEAALLARRLTVIDAAVCS